MPIRHILHHHFERRTLYLGDGDPRYAHQTLGRGLFGVLRGCKAAKRAQLLTIINDGGPLGDDGPVPVGLAQYEPCLVCIRVPKRYLPPNRRGCTCLNALLNHLVQLPFAVYRSVMPGKGSWEVKYNLLIDHCQLQLTAVSWRYECVLWTAKDTETLAARRPF